MALPTLRLLGERHTVDAAPVWGPDASAPAWRTGEPGRADRRHDRRDERGEAADGSGRGADRLTNRAILTAGGAAFRPGLPWRGPRSIRLQLSARAQKGRDVSHWLPLS